MVTQDAWRSVFGQMTYGIFVLTTRFEDTANLRITDCGLVDVEHFLVVPLFSDTSAG
jgi:hypothetical protein